MSFSSDSFDPVDARLAQWPHVGPEQPLPEDIEQRLRQALASLADDRERAVACCAEAVALATRQGDDGPLARTLFNAAGIVQLSGRTDRAYRLCLEAQALLERRDDRWRATHVLLLRGQCWLDVGEHERAARLIGDAVERFRIMQSPGDLARALAAMAMAQRAAGRLDDAQHCAQRALAMLEDGVRRHREREPGLNDELDLRVRGVAAQIRLDRARQCERAGDEPGAQSELAAAAGVLPPVLRIAGSANDAAGAATLDSLAQVAIATADAVALPRVLRWLSRPPRSRRRSGLAWLEIAWIQQRRGRPFAAIAAARGALRHLGADEREPRRVEIFLLLSDLLEAVGDFRGAHAAFERGLQIEAELQRAGIALRAEMLALERQAETELVSNEQTFAYAQRLSNVGHLVASVNHELNQPMASIRMLAETALELMDRDERDEVAASLRSMFRLSTRLTDLTAQLAAFPVQAEAAMAPIGLRAAVGEALAVLRSHLDKSACEIALHFDEVLVQAREDQLVRVIANIVHNALDALERTPAGRIAFTCEAGEHDVVLSIADNGPGLAPAVFDRLFQPFFSTKTAGKGLGLGLALSRDVMHEMGGELTARNAVGRGAMFDLRVRKVSTSPAANEGSSRN